MGVLMAVRVALLALICAQGAGAFSAPRSSLISRARPLTAVSAGFGKSTGSEAKTAKGKLNAKKQWDRFVDLSKDGGGTAEVAVRKDAESEWKPIGRVCAVAELPVVAAAARQRSLIEEHGKRVHLALLAQVGKAPLQVGIRVTAEASFELVGKEDNTASADSQIGFEGLPDPKTGYYCMYTDGRLITSGSASSGGVESTGTGLHPSLAGEQRSPRPG
ncbi:hypothetical protein T492DRAFT_1013964 [Pavlovales sp. CCMP2436]|nr:hypothetical protein T492DRAFT_1013964 [Pavlovales sp. CCMP2436]